MPPVEQPAALANLDKPFFLYLGVLHPKKNLHVLLAIAQAFPDDMLVLAGRNDNPYARHLSEQVSQLGVFDNVLQTGPVDEVTKSWLYAHCDGYFFSRHSAKVLACRLWKR